MALKIRKNYKKNRYLSYWQLTKWHYLKSLETLLNQQLIGAENPFTGHRSEEEICMDFWYSYISIIYLLSSTEHHISWFFRPSLHEWCKNIKINSYHFHTSKLEIRHLHNLRPNIETNSRVGSSQKIGTQD